MSGSESAPRRTRVLCLGDPFVDLVCERHVEVVSDAPSFVPRFGGAVPCATVVSARLGAPVALAGGAGDDAWGLWLRDRLRAEGADTTMLRLLPGVRTPLALVAVDGDGEAEHTFYGDPVGSLGAEAAERLEAALQDSAALFLSTNTLQAEREREVTMALRAQALEAGLPLIFDPNLRLHRWRSRADAAASANACVPGALLVRCSAAEAELMTGEDDPERAALALIKAGARLVVVSLGGEGAILRGELRADAEAPAVRVVSTLGAGDVLTGVLLGRLALSEFYPPAVAASLREAVVAASRACEQWSALG